MYQYLIGAVVVMIVVCDISSTVTTRDSGSIKQVPKNKPEQHEPSTLELNIDGCVAAIFIGRYNIM
jgi:hypothetical protein